MGLQLQEQLLQDTSIRFCMQFSPQCHILPQFSAVFGLCVVRIVWVFTYFASHRGIDVLYVISAFLDSDTYNKFNIICFLF